MGNNIVVHEAICGKNVLFLLTKMTHNECCSFFSCSNPGYREYKNSTSPLIILPPYCYKRLPLGLKCCACAECPCYNHLDDVEGGGEPLNK